MQTQEAFIVDGDSQDPLWNLRATLAKGYTVAHVAGTGITVGGDARIIQGKWLVILNRPIPEDSEK